MVPRPLVSIVHAWVAEKGGEKGTLWARGRNHSHMLDLLARNLRCALQALGARVAEVVDDDDLREAPTRVRESAGMVERREEGRKESASTSKTQNPTCTRMQLTSYPAS